MDVEVPLAGGDVTEGVVRVGYTVRRPRGPWSNSVANYLQHLKRVGFPESPRYLGVDELGRDILQFIPGEVPGQPVAESWAAADSVLVAIADLLRRLHEASASLSLRQVRAGSATTYTSTCLPTYVRSRLPT